jgi:hypothetical protein
MTVHARLSLAVCLRAAGCSALKHPMYIVRASHCVLLLTPPQPFQAPLLLRVYSLKVSNRYTKIQKALAHLNNFICRCMATVEQDEGKRKPHTTLDSITDI